MNLEKAIKTIKESFDKINEKDIKVLVDRWHLLNKELEISIKKYDNAPMSNRLEKEVIRLENELTTVADGIDPKINTTIHGTPEYAELVKKYGLN